MSLTQNGRSPLQRLFEDVANQLMNQDKRAYDRIEGQCRYFDAKTKCCCAIGGRIPWFVYSPAIEGMTISSMFGTNAIHPGVRERFRGVAHEAAKIVRDYLESQYPDIPIKTWESLQEIHDIVRYDQPEDLHEEWKEKLIAFAKEHRLDYSFLTADAGV